MTDIERELRALGERARDAQTGPFITPRARRRIKVRRMATAATSVVVVAALAFGGTYAAGMLGDSESNVAPANNGSSDGSTEVLYSHFGPGQRAEIEMNATDGTVCFSLSSVRGYGSFTVEIVEGLSSKTPVGLGVPSYPGRTPPRGSTECLTIVGSDIIGAILAFPNEYFLLLEDPVYGERVSSLVRGGKVDGLTNEESPSRCGPPVDFQPTYLPEGWNEERQPGSGGGAAWKVIGHYGNDAPPGTTDKADGGFAELFEGESPYPLRGGEKIRVLGEPARFGAIHEGFSVEFARNGCDYVLLGFVAGDELRRFAEGLELASESDARGTARCGTRVDFEPTYLPDGWTKELQAGSGGGTDYPGLVGHYGSGTERQAGSFDLVAEYPPFAQSNKRKLAVLGEQATSGDIHEGYSVEFRRGECTYILFGYGFERAELERFAEGLQPKG